MTTIEKAAAWDALQAEIAHKELLGKLALAEQSVNYNRDRANRFLKILLAISEAQGWTSNLDGGIQQDVDGPWIMLTGTYSRAEIQAVLNT